MSKRILREELLVRAEVRDTPKTAHEVDRTFEVPKGLYGATVACYLGFLAIMALGFTSPGLIIPMAIFTFFIAAGFGVPAIWTRLAPATKSKPMTLGQFSNRGIMTATGRLKARDATVQMLILPTLIVCWAIIVVTIAALV